MQGRALALLVLAAAPALAQPPPETAPEAAPAGAIPPPPPPAGDPNPPPPPPPTGQPPAYAQTPAPPDAEVHGADERHHGGFYLRLGLGIALLLMQRDSSVDGNPVTEPLSTDASITGGAGVFDIAMGGTVGSGVAIGGVLILHNVNSPVLERDDGTSAELGGDLGFLVLAAFVDWFPDVRGGFHFGAGLGGAFALAEAPDGSVFDYVGGGGPALSVHLGYDFWISSQWSLGGMLRWTGAALTGEDTVATPVGDITGREKDRVSVLALTFTALYH
jgi:hypothetical protein